MKSFAPPYNSVSGPFQMTITGLSSFTKYYFQTYIIVETPSGKIRIFTSNKSLASSELYGGVIVTFCPVTATFALDTSIVSSNVSSLAFLSKIYPEPF